MATLEERLTSLEHDQAELKQNNAELKEKVELHTLAIGGLVNKAMLEAINEKNDKIFQALEAHDHFTNVQLAELREKVEVDVEGKIAGLQTEVRQGFGAVNARLETMATKDDLSAMNARFDQIVLLLNSLTPKQDK